MFLDVSGRLDKPRILPMARDNLLNDLPSVLFLEELREGFPAFGFDLLFKVQNPPDLCQN